MLSPAEVFKELVWPLRSASSLLAGLLFFFCFSLIPLAAQLSPILHFAVSVIVGLALLPAASRFLMGYLYARARGVDADPLDAESFSWMRDLWGVFPIIQSVIIGWLVFRVQELDVPYADVAVLAAATLIMPASLISLAITHSPVQAMNPVTLVRLILRCKTTYWIAPLAVAVAGGIFVLLRDAPILLLAIIMPYVLLAVFGILGAITRPHQILDDIEIGSVDDGTPSIPVAQRKAALNLAYSYMSRDGVANGIAHIEGAIDEEGADLDAWDWYFEGMLAWENPIFACRFGQRYLRELLDAGDLIGASKLVMRCRLLDERFKPRPEDLEETVSALQQTGNAELASLLSR